MSVSPEPTTQICHWEILLEQDNGMQACAKELERGSFAWQQMCHTGDPQEWMEEESGHAYLAGLGHIYFVVSLLRAAAEHYHADTHSPEFAAASERCDAAWTAKAEAEGRYLDANQTRVVNTWLYQAHQANHHREWPSGRLSYGAQDTNRLACLCIRGEGGAWCADSIVAPTFSSDAQEGRAPAW